MIRKQKVLYKEMISLVYVLSGPSSARGSPRKYGPLRTDTACKNAHLGNNSSVSLRHRKEFRCQGYNKC